MRGEGWLGGGDDYMMTGQVLWAWVLAQATQVVKLLALTCRAHYPMEGQRCKLCLSTNMLAITQKPEHV